MAAGAGSTTALSSGVVAMDARTKAKMQGYDPHWTMVHTSRISKGRDYCEFAVRPTSEESKPD